MSEAAPGEDGREENDQRKAEVGGGNGSSRAGGNRDSVISNSGEGPTQETALQPPQPPQQQQAVVEDDPIEKAEAGRNQVKRHVEVRERKTERERGNIYIERESARDRTDTSPALQITLTRVTAECYSRQCRNCYRRHLKAAT